jgi:hypothetical protein
VCRGCPLLGAGGRVRTGDQTMTKSDAMTARPWHPFVPGMMAVSANHGCTDGYRRECRHPLRCQSAYTDIVSKNYDIIRNISIYVCRVFGRYPPPPAGRSGHHPGAPTGPAPWSSACQDSLTKGALPTPVQAALHVQLHKKVGHGPHGCQHEKLEFLE